MTFTEWMQQQWGKRLDAIQWKMIDRDGRRWLYDHYENYCTEKDVIPEYDFHMIHL